MFEPGNQASVERTETFSIDKTRSITLACVVIKDGPCAWIDALELVRIPEEAPSSRRFGGLGSFGEFGRRVPKSGRRRNRSLLEVATQLASVARPTPIRRPRRLAPRAGSSGNPRVPLRPEGSAWERYGRARSDELAVIARNAACRLQSGVSVPRGKVEPQAGMICARRRSITFRSANGGDDRYWHSPAVQPCPLLRRLVGESGNVANSTNSTLLTHLRHHRAIFAVMHSGVVPQRCGNVSP